MMTLVEMGRNIDFRPKSENSSVPFFKACVDLNLPNYDDEGVVGDIVRSKKGQDKRTLSADVASSDFSLCLNSGVDVFSQLWHHRTGSFCGKPSDNVVLAFVEMGALDSQYVPIDINDALFPERDHDDPNLLGQIFLSYIKQTNYNMIEKLVNACPSVFSNHCFCQDEKVFVVTWMLMSS